MGKELVGLYISDHPLNRHEMRLRENKVRSIKELKSLPAQPNQNYSQTSGNNFYRIAGVLGNIKKSSPKTGNR